MNSHAWRVATILSLLGLSSCGLEQAEELPELDALDAVEDSVIAGCDLTAHAPRLGSAGNIRYGATLTCSPRRSLDFRLHLETYARSAQVWLSAVHDAYVDALVTPSGVTVSEVDRCFGTGEYRTRVRAVAPSGAAESDVSPSVYIRCN